MSDACGNLAIQSGETIVLIGDSITDCQRRGAYAPLGSGYVSMIVSSIRYKYPERDIVFLNEGIGGDVVTGLRDRWADDVLRHEPDWVSVKIGINDLHRTLRGAPDPVPPELFREAYHDILARTAGSTEAKLILVDPFYLSRETHPTSFRTKVLALLPEYLAVVADMAGEFDALHVKTHEMFAAVLAHYPSDYFCPEPVHPFDSGHLMIAHEWLQTMDW